jgi:hypothetical protein
MQWGYSLTFEEDAALWFEWFPVRFAVVAPKVVRGGT